MAKLRTTLDSESCTVTNESWSVCSGAYLTLEQSIILNSHPRDHQVIFPCTGDKLHQIRQHKLKCTGTFTIVT